MRKWPTVTIDAIKSRVRHALVGGPFGSNLTTRDYVDDGVPVIRGGNLPDDCAFLDRDFVFVREEKADELLPNNAHRGDLVFTQRGTLGQVGLIPETARHERYVISQSQMKLTVNDELVYAPFVYYFFRHPITVQTIRNYALTSGVPHINLGILKDITLPLPSLPAQRRIASILSAYDDLIENNNRRIALLEQAARLLYEEWFVRLRFPGREHTRIVEGVPKGWRRCRLDMVAEINRETLSGKHDGQIEYVDIASVTPGEIGATTTYDFRDAPGRARRVVRHGDIIWSCVRPNRRSHAVVWNPPDNLIASTGFAVITPMTVPTSYLYRATTTDAFTGYLVNRARGAAYPAVVAGDFEEAEIVVPPTLLIEAFDDFAQPTIAHAQTLRVQNRKLKAARDLLLPRLMNGEVGA